MKYYTIGQFSEKVGKSIQTLRVWDTENKLKPHHVTDGGHRYYSEEQPHMCGFYLAHHVKVKVFILAPAPLIFATFTIGT